MRFASREKSMEDFKNKEDISIMIASLKVGGTGLNLTMANKCILVEPWWNEAIAQQVSISQVHFGRKYFTDIDASCRPFAAYFALDSAGRLRLLSSLQIRLLM